MNKFSIPFKLFMEIACDEFCHVVGAEVAKIRGYEAGKPKKEYQFISDEGIFVVKRIEVDGKTVSFDISIT